MIFDGSQLLSPTPHLVGRFTAMAINPPPALHPAIQPRGIRQPDWLSIPPSGASGLCVHLDHRRFANECPPARTNQPHHSDQLPAAGW
jgi:hypothetical protein